MTNGREDAGSKSIKKLIDQDKYDRVLATTWQMIRNLKNYNYIKDVHDISSDDKQV